MSESVRRRWRAWSLGLMLLPATLFAQDRQITGRVTRSSGGTAVADAEVTVVGACIFATTSDGKGQECMVSNDFSHG